MECRSDQAAIHGSQHGTLSIAVHVHDDGSSLVPLAIPPHLCRALDPLPVIPPSTELFLALDRAATCTYSNNVVAGN